MGRYRRLVDKGSRRLVSRYQTACRSPVNAFISIISFVGFIWLSNPWMKVEDQRDELDEERKIKKTYDPDATGINTFEGPSLAALTGLELSGSGSWSNGLDGDGDAGDEGQQRGCSGED